MVQNKIHKIANSIIDSLKPCYKDMKANKLLAKELTGIKDRMIVNIAFLIENEKKEALENALKEISEKYPNCGFLFHFTGPWPPYNFC